MEGHIEVVIMFPFPIIDNASLHRFAQVNSGVRPNLNFYQADIGPILRISSMTSPDWGMHSLPATGCCQKAAKRALASSKILVIAPTSLGCTDEFPY